MLRIIDMNAPSLATDYKSMQSMCLPLMSESQGKLGPLAINLGFLADAGQRYWSNTVILDQ